MLRFDAFKKSAKLKRPKKPSCAKRRSSVTGKSAGKRVFAVLTFVTTAGRNIVKLLAGELQVRSCV